MQNLEIIGIVNAYTAQKEQAAKDRKEGLYAHELGLPAAVAWKRRVNMDKLFRAKGLIDEALREINDKYIDDDHSEEIDIVYTDDSGMKKTRKERRVKEEFIAEFTKARGDILLQDTELDVRKVKIEDLGDVELTDEDMDTLAFMLEDGE